MCEYIHIIALIVLRNNGLLKKAKEDDKYSASADCRRWLQHRWLEVLCAGQYQGRN